MPAVSDVPGPNSYNIDPGPPLQPSAFARYAEFSIVDSQLDSYKHGAFLEKADRFTEARQSDVPGEPHRSPYLLRLLVPDTLLEDRARTPNLTMELPISFLQSAS